MIINESEEMYLETIYILGKKHCSVRAIDIATELNYTKASVSVALKKLEQANYITRNNQGEISLTEKGLSKANNIYARHSIITNLLMKVGAPKEIAEDNACRIEHVISDEMFEILKKYVGEK